MLLICAPSPKPPEFFILTCVFFPKRHQIEGSDTCFGVGTPTGNPGSVIEKISLCHYERKDLWTKVLLICIMYNEQCINYPLLVCDTQHKVNLVLRGNGFHNMVNRHGQRNYRCRREIRIPAKTTVNIKFSDN